MDDEMMVLTFPRGNDVIVTARFGDTLTDATGMTSKFWRKDERTLPDSDASAKSYTANIVADPDNPGQFKAEFTVPHADNAVVGITWWRIDALSASGNIRTARCGPLNVEAV
jgi:hypothetical protein